MSGVCGLVAKNIARDSKNSVLIMALVASITFLFFMGNIVIGGTERGLREAYVESLTGEVVLQKTSPVTLNLFGANTPVVDEFFVIPEFPAVERALAIARAEPGVARVTRQVSTKAFVESSGVQRPALICGVDPGTYGEAFPGLILEAGRFLAPGEHGALITAERAGQIREQGGGYPEIGGPLLLTAGGARGFKIREVPLVGIFRYPNPGPLMNEIVMTDPQTARALAGVQVASAGTPAGDTAGFFDAPLEDLFGGAEPVGPASSDADEEGGFSPESIAEYLGGFAAGEPGQAAGGGWNFIILRLEGGARPGKVIASLNEKLNAMGATAVGWRVAAGNSAILLLLVQALFNGGIFLVGAAGVIAAVNILLISVFRRTREIGTLRAMGAGDGYVVFLVLGENLFLSAAGGGLGVLLGAWCIRAVNRAHIAIPNALVASLLGGGPALALRFIPAVAAASLGVALLLGLAASAFPVGAALRVDPIVAVARG